ncbi:MAG: serine/threonine protein kinase [Cellvibrionaceae bacterium]|nr:serine/threonine protein kinase [Cellvibrionaceae bacterium]
MPLCLVECGAMDNENPTHKRMPEQDETRRTATREESGAATTLARGGRQPEPSSPTLARDAADDQTRPASNLNATRIQVKPRVHPSSDTLATPSQSANTTVVNPDISRLSDSVFAHLEKRIAESYKGMTVLKERFVLLQTLGSGGMGNVYLAKDLLREEMDDSDSLIAIKVLNEECRRLPGALQSLQREAKKAQALSHPNIVTVYDFDRDGDNAFITMEYIEGDSLKEHLRSNGRMPFEKAFYVIERVARGLAYAHQQGFAHADIKPANIFLSKSDVVKILDFGIAKAFTEATKEKRTLADALTEGALTPGYASLEMLQGHTPMPVDDVYSLACMYYEILRGRHPFIGADGLPMPADVARDKGAKLENIVGIPRRQMRALRRGLEFERDKRFKDAGEFLDAIKKRNLKKDLGLLSLAAVATGTLIFLTSTALDQVVPSVTSLKPALSAVGEAIIEGDQFLATQDIDLAHRLYSQAWELANDLTVNDVAEREKVHAILEDRMIQVSNQLIERSRDESIDEYQLRELFVALEFLAKDEIAGNERKIEAALKNIDKRLQRFESKK